jgi:hypothetical protein
LSAKLSLQKILRTLDAYEVDYVIIGGVGAILQGVDLPRTLDLDVAAAHQRSNLRKLSAALQQMGATLRTGPVEDPMMVSAPLDEQMLTKTYLLTMMTRFGPLDVLFEPPGMPPYATLKRRSAPVDRFGLQLHVASLEDIVASKRVAGREKDAAHLTILLEFIRAEESRATEGGGA